MAYETILADVKSALGITGNFQDKTIQEYIDEVKQVMIDGGVAESIVNSKEAKGVITRGVSDLWNYGSGGTDLSPYFYKRVIQLALKGNKPIKKAEFYTKDQIDDIIDDLSIIKSSFIYSTIENQSEFEFTGEYDVIEVRVNRLQTNKDDFIVSGNKVILKSPLTANQTVEIILMEIGGN